MGVLVRSRAIGMDTQVCALCVFTSRELEPHRGGEIEALVRGMTFG